jgi:hypothetical protein
VDEAVDEAEAEEAEAEAVVKAVVKVKVKVKAKVYNYKDKWRFRDKWRDNSPQTKCNNWLKWTMLLQHFWGMSLLLKKHHRFNLKLHNSMAVWYLRDHSLLLSEVRSSAAAERN